MLRCPVQHPSQQLAQPLAKHQAPKLSAACLTEQLLGCRGKSLASQSLSDAGDDEGEEDISSVMKQ